MSYLRPLPSTSRSRNVRQSSHFAPIAPSMTSRCSAELDLATVAPAKVPEPPAKGKPGPGRGHKKTEAAPSAESVSRGGGQRSEEQLRAIAERAPGPARELYKQGLLAPGIPTLDPARRPDPTISAAIVATAADVQSAAQPPPARPPSPAEGPRAPGPAHLPVASHGGGVGAARATPRGGPGADRRLRAPSGPASLQQTRPLRSFEARALPTPAADRADAPRGNLGAAMR